MNKFTVLLMILLTGCLPKAPDYPFSQSTKANQEVNKISSDLESYINNWMDGKASALTINL
jgi:hypothetical protein